MSSNEWLHVNSGRDFNRAAYPLPPMGVNSYGDVNFTNLDEGWVTNTVMCLYTNGLVGLGYKLIVLDDKWTSMYTNPLAYDANGLVRLATLRFPHFTGPSLGRWIHSMGMKWGLWYEPGLGDGVHHRDESDGAAPTNGFWQAMDTITNWGVDYLKIGGYPASAVPTFDLQSMSSRMWISWMTSFNRPVFIYGMPSSLSGVTYPQPWYDHYYGAWRQVDPFGNGPPDNGLQQPADVNFYEGVHWWRIMTNYLGFIRPGHYANLGEICPYLLDLPTTQTLMGQFCIMSSHLILYPQTQFWSSWAGDGRLGVITNREAIAINQDPLVAAPYMYTNDANLEVWAKPLANGDTAMLLWNPNTNPPVTASMTVGLGGIGGGTNRFTVRDIWNGTTATLQSSLTAVAVPGRGCRFWRLTPAPPSAGFVPPFSPVAADQVWFPAQQGLTVGAGTNRLMDFGASGLDLYIRTGANPPITAGPNNQPTFRLNGATGAYTTNFATISQPFTVVTVVKINGSLSGGFVFDSVDSVNRCAFADLSPVSIYAGGPVPAPVAQDQWLIVEILYSGANSFIKTNNVVCGSGNPGGNTMGGLTLGKRFSLDFSGDVNFAYFAIHRRALTQAEEANNTAYLKQVFGL